MHLESLNYNHLFYFWVVAREGSITSACRQLLVSQPTVSAQIKSLEESLGFDLFTRSGRKLVLTDTGRLVYHRAEEIFSLGQDLLGTLRGRTAGTDRLRLNVGVTDGLPKLLVFNLLRSAMKLPEPVAIVCEEGKHRDLLARLSVFELDLILTDAPVGVQARVKAFNHLLGECGVSVFAARRLAAHYRKGFPGSLEEAPFLLPTAGTGLRRSVNSWFTQQRINPGIAGEFEDSALIKLFGQAGLGLFIMPTVEEQEVLRQYDVRVVGRLSGVREKYYAISTERKVKHPAVLAITENAHRKLFE